MLTSSSTPSSANPSRSPHRDVQIRDAVADVVRKRSDGQPVSDAEVLAMHPDLSPELNTELKKLREIEQAFDAVERRQCQDAWRRLQEDWLHDEQWESKIAGDNASAPHSPVEHTETFPPAQPPSDRSSSQIPLQVDAPAEDDDSSSNDAVDLCGESSLSMVVGRYRLLELLGEGGFGRVYRAKDEQLDREVALKAPRRRRLTGEDALQAFLTEARIAASLDHPAIVPVYDANTTDNGQCYVVSKLIQGRDLASQMRRTTISTRDGASIVATVAHALHHAHSHGLVHRDIKPANILIDAVGKPYIVDFGLALKDDDLVHGRGLAGTPAYMSPEQVRGESHRVDRRSDIFSLGVVLYELLTGVRPFRAEAQEQLFEQVVWLDVQPPRELSTQVSEELERICLKMLAKRAVDRYATARDLYEDLQYFLRGEEATGATESPYQEAESGPSGISKQTLVIPKGLRPFDAGDAEWFLELVPGPHDRRGLPDCIRQWKTHIEQTDPGETFAVGVLYGPSGCGKSSLVQAGLLPRLAPHIHTLYLEASPTETEEQLLERMRRRFPVPDTGEELGLSSMLAELRRGEGFARGYKLLLVLDQFEQWLHGKGDRERRLLVEALRQCDGERIQCLLLVRDDFWLGLSRFLGDLEIGLVPGRNAALVDLFEPSHARNVLERFGRAWGRLPAPPTELTSSQVQFLQRAVAGLTQDDAVIPVRLALFAEMVRSRPWDLGTLRNVGGAEGVGVAFLESAFSARTANPQNRLHEEAARAVLAALLPDSDTDLRGRLRSSEELLDVSGYIGKPRAFRELMRILDSDTRLLTPAEPAASEGDDAATDAGQRYYQLTHDYLVPSLRQWLTEKRRSHRRGRAELCLEQRSAIWNTRPESRQLPSMREWISIRLLTRASRWTEAQHRMMAVAARRHAISLAGLAGVMMLVVFGGGELLALAGRLSVNLRVVTAPLSLALGREDLIWPLLAHQPDATVRTQVIHQVSPVTISPSEIVEQIRMQNEVSIRRAMLQAVGELAEEVEPAAEDAVRFRRVDLDDATLQELLRAYRDDADPGIHAAAEWCLRRFGRTEQLAEIDRQLATTAASIDRRWYVTGQGHVMIVAPGPVQFPMGSPGTDGDRRADEMPHAQQIHRTFSIGAKEITVAQFERFRVESRPLGVTGKPGAASSRLAQTSVTWYEAAAYCNWLSDVERILPDQWCYQANEQGRYAEGMTISPQFLQLRGYRLPTEAEWEFACRAGAITPRFFGRDQEYLEYYAVFDRDAPGTVGGLKPNDFGMFDTLGNAQEWCQDPYRPYDSPSAARGELLETVRDNGKRVVRGGSFRDVAENLRCAARACSTPSSRLNTIGFRIARSYR